MCTLELVPVPCPCCAEWINHEFPPFWTSPHAMINGETNLSSSLLIQFPGMFIDISVRMEWFLCILTLAYYFLLSWPLLSHCSHCRDFSSSWQDQRSTKFVGSCKVPWLPLPCVCTWRSEGGLSAIPPILPSETGAVVCCYACQGQELVF